MSQLQEYVDSQVATISPFKIKSQELLEQAKAKEVTDDATAKEAVAITPHQLLSGMSRRTPRKQVNRRNRSLMISTLASQWI